MALQNQQEQFIENGMNHEVIPLRRINSRDKPTRRQELREIFDQYDRSRTGYLNIRELKHLIRIQVCDNLPKPIVNMVLKASDTDERLLSFEQFYVECVKKNWPFKDYAIKYCKLIVPPPHRDDNVDDTDGAYESSMSCWPPPLTMLIFSILEIIVFLYDVIKLDEHHDQNLENIGLSTRGPAAQALIYNPFRREQAWRFFTYMFVHVGIMHLTMNLIVQIFLGTALELIHCWWRISLVYLAGVVAGSMGTSISDPRIFLAGASGGVYALITAHIATIIMNWKEMEYPVVQLLVFLIFCASDLGSSIHNHISNKNDQIGYIAHLSGAIAGLLVGIGVLRNLNVQSWEKVLWWCSVTIFFLLMIAGICVHIFVPSHFPTPNNYL